ncbi:hypothetical protein D5086_009305 [Populus alba]|uniref:Uncharacterized protein n=1 Tax=Populus alba TaxID=43335 RepID=A0ACC4CHZ3_POPAL
MLLVLTVERRRGNPKGTTSCSPDHGKSTHQEKHRPQIVNMTPLEWWCLWTLTTALELARRSTLLMMLSEIDISWSFGQLSFSFFVVQVIERDGFPLYFSPFTDLILRPRTIPGGDKFPRTGTVAGGCSIAGELRICSCSDRTAVKLSVLKWQCQARRH